ncbi:MAG: hypothetical protein LC676_18280 [Loktanella sp.]|nr:hypothetical protein [Loktanella sp.]
MTTQSQRNTCAAMDAIFNPLCKSLRDMRQVIEGWEDAEIFQALYIMDSTEPCEPDDTDISKTYYIQREALERENAKRIAKNAPWLDVTAKCLPGGKYAVKVAHDMGIVIEREFSTFDEAQAAGAALQEFISLTGRDSQFSYSTEPNPLRPTADDDSEIPF